MSFGQLRPQLCAVVFVAAALALLTHGIAEAKRKGSGREDRQTYIFIEPTLALYQPPVFLSPLKTNFHAALDVPYDLFSADSIYYLYQQGRWFRADFFDGPWSVITTRELPNVLRKTSIGKLRNLRDEAASEFRRQPELYEERYFIPEESAADYDGDDDEMIE